MVGLFWFGVLWVIFWGGGLFGVLLLFIFFLSQGKETSDNFLTSIYHFKSYENLYKGCTEVRQGDYMNITENLP